MPVILIVMVSKHYENNFQPVSVDPWKNGEDLIEKKKTENFPFFEKLVSMGLNL